MKPLGHFESTSYGPPWNAMNGTGVTAGGTDLRPAKQAHLVAVDPGEIPLGTQLYIWPNPHNHRGTYLADDTGGAIAGKRIDFYDWRGRDAQLEWGRREVAVAIAEKGDPGLSEIGEPGGDRQRNTSVDGGAGELVSDEQRSGLLKGLIWVVLVLGGAALAGLGLSRALGAGRAA